MQKHLRCLFTGKFRPQHRDMAQAYPPQWCNAKHVQPFVGPLVIDFFQPHPYCLTKSPSYLVNSHSTDMFAGSLPILRVKSNWLTSYKEYMFAGIERFANEILVVGWNPIYGYLWQHHHWLVVYLPLWKIWVRQLGWLFPIHGKS